MVVRFDVLLMVILEGTSVMECFWHFFFVGNSRYFLGFHHSIQTLAFWGQGFERASVLDLCRGEI